MGKLIESQSTPSEKVSDGPVTSSSRAQIPHVHHCAINHRPIVGASVRGHPPAAIGEDDLQHTCSSCSSSRPRMASDEAPPMASPDWPRVSRLALTGTDGNHGFRRWHVTPPRARRCEHAQGRPPGQEGGYNRPTCTHGALLEGELLPVEQFARGARRPTRSCARSVPPSTMVSWLGCCSALHTVAPCILY